MKLLSGDITTMLPVAPSRTMRYACVIAMPVDGPAGIPICHSRAVNA